MLLLDIYLQKKIFLEGIKLLSFKSPSILYETDNLKKLSDHNINNLN